MFGAPAILPATSCEWACKPNAQFFYVNICNTQKFASPGAAAYTCAGRVAF